MTAGLCPLCRGPMPTDEKTLKERLAVALSTPMDPGVVLDPTDDRLKAFSKPERRRIIAAMCACEGISTPMLEATCPSEFDVLKMLEERVRELQAARPEVDASAERDRHIEGFRDLNANWDSYGAEKMTEATIQLGLKISKTLGAEWKVVPCADGPSVWFYRGDEEEIIQAWSSSPTEDHPSSDQRVLQRAR